MTVKRTLTHDDLLRIMKLRHGSWTDPSVIEASYPEIGKKLHIPFQTCHQALKRFK